MVDQSQRTIADAEAEVLDAGDISWDVTTDVLIAGGGGTGLVAALAACENPELTVTVLEKSPDVGGNTSLSTGMIPAAGTRLQREAGIDETPADMARDILEKNDYEADEAMVHHLCEETRHLIHWLVDDWDVSLSLIDDFKYPKHSAYRMHAPPGRNGENLIADLLNQVRETENIELLTNTPVTKIVAGEGEVVGVVAGERREEAIGAEKVILATDGFGGNREMITEWCPAIEDALYFGTDGNTGDGVRWGTALGGDLAYMDAYQGHATVASGSLSTYAVVMNGGILVNANGERFGDESAGYSSFAVDVLRQPNSHAFEIFDERIFDRLNGEFDDFDEAISQGVYTIGNSIEELAATTGFDDEAAAAAVERYNAAVQDGRPDETGRTDGMHELTAPFYVAKVTGALFHTQGGLVVDEYARVLRKDGSQVKNLYAGGGTACGISGHGPGGYLSGNGLTTALGFGRLAGQHARRMVVSDLNDGK